MGLRTKQVSGDHQGLENWSQTLLPPSTAEELPKPLLIRRQQPLIQQSEPLNCPRCGSTNTKFCYYNNYNKSQPRHFCKSCKRHWTKGGTLRNVPVGGGRKNKHPRISDAGPTTTTASASASTTTATMTRASTITATAPRQQDCPSYPHTKIEMDQTSMSNILHKALIGTTSSPLLHNTTDGISISEPVKSLLGSNGITNMTSSNISAPQNPNTEHPIFSKLSTTFDKDTSLIYSTSYQSLIDPTDHYSMNLNSMEESTITTFDIPTTSSVPWPGPEINSSMDFSNYWNWNEIEVLTSSSDLNIAWDDVINP